MKTIVVILNNLSHVNDVLSAASYIAGKNQCHVIGLYPIPGIVVHPVTYPSGIALRDEGQKNLFLKEERNVRSTFEDCMIREGINFEWRKIELDFSVTVNTIVDHCRTADLTILFHDTSDPRNARNAVSFSADIVLATGRPTLLIPPRKGKEFEIEKVVAGWNGAREAARAIFDSIPIIQLANDVHLVWINRGKDKSVGLQGAELASSLARYDIKMNATSLNSQTTTGKTLINYSHKENADLLVIGAYGRSRLRERILSGTTEYILNHMDLPVLMSN